MSQKPLTAKVVQSSLSSAAPHNTCGGWELHSSSTTTCAICPKYCVNITYKNFEYYFVIKYLSKMVPENDFF